MWRAVRIGGGWWRVFDPSGVGVCHHSSALRALRCLLSKPRWEIAARGPQT